MSSPATQTANDHPNFTFVTKENRHHVRSHAMREHWKKRRHKLSSQKNEQSRRAPRQILPSRSDDGGPRNDGSPSATISTATATYSSLPKSRPSSHPSSHPSTSATTPTTTSSVSVEPIILPDAHRLAVMEGIPKQALSAMNLALGSSRLDPFDKFPVKLTAQHHKLLHHWLSTYAAMMFDLHESTFNPMRDVWFPLDLSNAASFNAIMAHSAAHLARMQGHRNSKEALMFKAEAVRIVNRWLGDPNLATGDEVISAVLRLLTYERYWGTEAEWRIHHQGLLRIIAARGGIEALEENWRLELAAFLVTLMTKPSWFDSSNQLREICQQTMFVSRHHPIIGSEGNLFRTRCLWLLSFIQDMGTFMSNSPEIYLYGLAYYSSIHDVVLLLKADRWRYRHEEIEDTDAGRNGEFMRLTCLFFICVTLQAAASRQGDFAEDDHPSSSSNTHSLSYVDRYLQEQRTVWQGSVQRLYLCLFEGLAKGESESHRTIYVHDMANLLGSMSSEARDGVERCLLSMLCKAAKVGYAATCIDEWTPDLLLSSIHGH